jgi:hypothetical protein
LNKPVSWSTTMQTRRPETPLPPSPVQEIIAMDSKPSRLRQVRSVWSFSAASEAPPSSTSVYSTSSRTKLFEQPQRDPSPEPFLLPSPQLPSPPLSIYDPEESRPRLQSLLPPPKVWTPPPPLPIPPRNPLRKSNIPARYLSPSALLDADESPHTRQSRQPPPLSPSPAFIELPLTESSESTIERWLDSSKGTESAFGSIIGENIAEGGSVAKPKAPRTQSLKLFPKVQSARSSTRRFSEREPQWIDAAF